MHRRAGVDRGARRKRADPERGCGSVGGDNRDVVRGAAKVIGGDLGKRGLVRLALWRCASVDSELAAGRYTNRRALVGAEPGGLDRVADAEPDIAPLFACRLLPRAEGFVIDGGERVALTDRVVAAVIGDRAA